MVKTDLGAAVELSGGGLLPVRQILGIGLNYARHARETGAELPERPVLFTKSPMAATVNGEAIVIPRACQDPSTGPKEGPDQTDYEAELGVVIGTAARDVTEASALSHVLGYCCANDVSARWWQKQGSGGQFCRGKSFDTYAPLGDVVAASEVADPQALGIRCRVNGELLQDASTSDMVFPVRRLIAELSRGMTLIPGTVILTGTPSGVGVARTPRVWLRGGDVVEIEIDGLPTLRNPVIYE